MTPRPALAAVLLLPVLLSGCSDSDKDEFVTACAEMTGDAAGCDCAYDLGNDSLNDKEFAVFKALVLGDARAEARARAELGILGSAAAYSQILWLAANAETACAA